MINLVFQSLMIKGTGIQGERVEKASKSQYHYLGKTGSNQMKTPITEMKCKFVCGYKTHYIWEKKEGKRSNSEGN